MHIGLDFDNTIVSYDILFHKVALEGGITMLSQSENQQVNR